MKGTAEKLFQVTLHDDITVIHISKEVRDKARIMEFGDDLVAYCEEHRPLKVQMNFEYVVFFGSEAISALIRAQRRIREFGGRMNLCGMTKDQRGVFRMCQLDGHVFEIHDLCRESMAALRD